MAEAHASTSSGTSESSSASDSAERQAYLEAKYGDKKSHVKMTKQEVEAALDRALNHSGPVKYMLESLQLVHGDDGGVGGGGAYGDIHQGGYQAGRRVFLQRCCRLGWRP